jgi:hypothetical protein
MGRPLQTDRARDFFRIVIGCYHHGERHKSARDELRSAGLQDRQICSFGSRSALTSAGAPADYSTRMVRDLEIHVSAVSLFDELWPAPHQFDGSLTRWMTPAQSGVVWRELCDDRAVLMVSAESDRQQIENSRIQLKHSPAVVQAFNFAV